MPEPLVEEGLQVVAGSFLHGLHEVVGGGRAVQVTGIIGADAPLEGLVANPLPEHVQHPGALLVGGHAGHPRHVLEVVVDDAIVGILIVPEPHALSRLAEAGDEVVPSVRVLAEEQCEVGRESFAQPHVVPLGLGDRVAEPLVCDLVDDDVAPAHRACRP